jgi:hypothetical protein
VRGRVGNLGARRVEQMIEAQFKIQADNELKGTKIKVQTRAAAG